MSTKRRYPAMVRLALNVYLTTVDEDGRDLDTSRHLVRNVWINPEDLPKLEAIIDLLDQFAPSLQVAPAEQPVQLGLTEAH